MKGEWGVCKDSCVSGDGEVMYQAQGILQTHALTIHNTSQEMRKMCCQPFEILLANLMIQNATTIGYHIVPLSNELRREVLLL